MKIAIGCFVALSLAACSSVSGICAERHGAYQATYTERDGTCGALREQIAVIDKEPTAADLGCQGTETYSNDNCTVFMNLRGCPSQNGFTFDMIGEGKWSLDGANGTAVVQMIIHDPSGKVICSSTYDMKSSRL